MDLFPSLWGGKPAGGRNQANVQTEQPSSNGDEPPAFLDFLYGWAAPVASAFAPQQHKKNPPAGIPTPVDVPRRVSLDGHPTMEVIIDSAANLPVSEPCFQAPRPSRYLDARMLSSVFLCPGALRLCMQGAQARVCGRRWAGQAAAPWCGCRTGVRTRRQA